MIKETDYVVDLLNDTKNVEEKLMFLSLYNEFYNMYFKTFSPTMLNCYEGKFEEAIDETLRILSFYPYNQKTYNSISLMDEFIGYFGYKVKNDIFGLKGVAEDSYKEKIRELAATKKHINIIDGYDMSLEEKANIALTVDEYVRYVKGACSDIYYKDFADSLSDSIYDNICKKLPEFIEENKDLHDMELYTKLYKYLQYDTKDYLIEKYKNKEIDFLSEINDYTSDKILPKYKESDKAMASAYAIFAISGISSNNPKDKKQIRKEIAELAESTPFEATLYAAKGVAKINRTILLSRFKR